MVRIDDSGDEVKSWMTYPDEVDQLLDEMRDTSWESRIAGILMGKVGSRASGALTASPAGLSYNDKGEYWQLEIRGKNTKGGSKTTRDAYVPDAVKRELDNYQKERDLRPSDPYVDKSVDTVRRWVREAADRLSEEESDRWQHVSSHDLRRSWATHHLVEQDVSPRVMMEIGGWSSYSAMEPYMDKPSPSKIAEEMV